MEYLQWLRDWTTLLDRQVSGERLHGIRHQGREVFPIENRLDFAGCRLGLVLTSLSNSRAGGGSMGIGPFRTGSSSTKERVANKFPN